ncbi:hypothetical protein JG687_00007480 [Phytophthora cactorum]|uniref:Protein kinase domain-containing protein n=1 Tax=Phytophthora cactorum TaxID=29920 RepID=A0A8T1UK06_9STRA|nr:hypothetical protein JG687_00007480 [Phytophthora cactorum]
MKAHGELVQKFECELETRRTSEAELRLTVAKMRADKCRLEAEFGAVHAKVRQLLEQLNAQSIEISKREDVLKAFREESDRQLQAAYEKSANLMEEKRHLSFQLSETKTCLENAKHENKLLLTTNEELNLRANTQEYTLLEFLGEGATAQVYLAEHEASGAHVAIKVIDKLLVQRAQLESKVRQEMVLHAELRHPHVLHVESVFEDARNYYMVLEYCARRSLSVVVKTLSGRKMDEQTVKKIFRQVVAGVVYLHASGVIHRDLKLANLLLNDKGEVKISDFGLAARLGDDHVTMCGTPNFIAPEVLMAEDEPYDEAPPFEGRKVSETLENVANAGQNPLKFPDGFSSSASDLIKRLLTPGLPTLNEEAEGEEDDANDENPETIPSAISTSFVDKLSSAEVVAVRQEQEQEERDTYDIEFIEMLEHLSRGKLDFLALTLGDLTIQKLKRERKQFVTPSVEQCNTPAKGKDQSLDLIKSFP